MNELTPEEMEAVYYALGEHWEEEMKDMLAHHQGGRAAVINLLQNSLRHTVLRLENVSGMDQVVSMKKKKGIENKPYIEAMREIRRSNASAPHEDSRTKRARTRKASKNKSIEESKESE